MKIALKQICPITIGESWSGERRVRFRNVVKGHQKRKHSNG
jgi:hypothetical protein